MDKDRIAGSANQAKGAIKQVAGKVTGDAKLQAEGSADKAAGKVQNAVGGAKDAFHRLQVDPLARHVGRALVFLENLRESRGLTLRFGNRLELVALGFLDDRCRPSARFRHDAIGIGLGLVAEPVLILLCSGHIAKGGNDLLRGIDRLQLHLQDQHAGFVGVEDLLHQILDGRFDHLAFGR